MQRLHPGTLVRKLRWHKGVATVGSSPSNYSTQKLRKQKADAHSLILENITKREVIDVPHDQLYRDATLKN